MRLPRPYIPLRVRVQVAERQFIKKFGVSPEMRIPAQRSQSKWLALVLKVLFGDTPVELHHRPALVNREKRLSAIDSSFIAYHPPANDPDFLVYLPKDEHDVETRVRGQHGQHSDLALARKRKRVEKKRSGTFKARRMHTARSVKGSGAAHKYRWPKRKLRSRKFTVAKQEAARC